MSRGTCLVLLVIDASGTRAMGIGGTGSTYTRTTIISRMATEDIVDSTGCTNGMDMTSFTLCRLHTSIRAWIVHSGPIHLTAYKAQEIICGMRFTGALFTKRPCASLNCRRIFCSTLTDREDA